MKEFCFIVGFIIGIFGGVGLVVFTSIYLYETHMEASGQQYQDIQQDIAWYPEVARQAKQIIEDKGRISIWDYDNLKSLSLKEFSRYQKKETLAKAATQASR